MNVFLRNARARNGHVEATLNHPFPAQVDCGGDADLAFDAVNGDVAATSTHGDVHLSLSADVGADVVLLARGAIDATGAENFDATDATDGAVRGVLVPVAKPQTRKGAGKVNAAGAESQRWDSAVTTAEARPTIRVDAEQGSASLKTLSWIDSIRRQVGLPEGFENVRRTGRL